MLPASHGYDKDVIVTAALREVLKQVVGTKAWRSRAGNGTGSIFTLAFNATAPTKEQYDREQEQHPFSIMVYCAWRIVDATQVLCSWRDDSDEVIAPGLAALEGHIVSEITLSTWNDLTFRFADGRELQIINDFSPHEDYDASWFITHNENTHYGITPDNSVTLSIN